MKWISINYLIRFKTHDVKLVFSSKIRVWQVVAFSLYSLVGYEGLEVINPDGGTDDVHEEASKGRWKQEVRYSSAMTKPFFLYGVCL